MNTEVFEKIGLTKNEAKVYLTLIDLGSAKAGEITEKSGIHRRNVYDSLSRLTEKGLISSVLVNNNKVFSPVNPKRFINIIEEKKFNLDNLKNEFERVLPELELKTRLQKRNEVRLYKGIEGIKTVFEGILRTDKNYIGYGPWHRLKKILKHYFKHFTSRRIEAKIKARIVYNDDSYEKIKVEKFIAARYIPKEYGSHAAVVIYGNKTAILLISEEPLAIIIDNKSITDSYRKYFEVMWKAANP